MALPRLTIQVDFSRIAANVRAIRSLCGTEVWAVVKANAYGLGIERVSNAIAPLVDGFCVFSLDEAIESNLAQRTGKPVLAMGPPEPRRLGHYLAHRVRPAVCDPDTAHALRRAQPVLCVDCGMQRFTAPPELIDATLQAGDIREAFAHATTLGQVEQLRQQVGDRGLKLHAAATSLLNEPRAWLDAVRPGLAMYAGAVRVAAPLVDVRESRGPLGYTGFGARRHGIILGGYSDGLRPGPCLVNGSATRLPEVGMQSSYVDLTEVDAQVGDTVVLLGDGLDPAAVGGAWHCSPHEVLIRLAQRITDR